MIATVAAPPRIRALRLVLRPPTAEDASALAVLANDFDIARMTTSIPHPITLAETEAFLERVSRFDPRRETLFVVETDGAPCGLLGFNLNDDGATEVGYWLGRPFWGSGLMTEALEAALAWAGDIWGKRFIMAGHFADNPASGRVLVKAGFLYTGEVLPRFSTARGEEAATRMMVWLA
jgi:RimJ/RimL family protein N-acetyltransferase